MEEGWEIDPEDLAHISPYLTEHINRFGEYSTHELGSTSPQLPLMATVRSGVVGVEGLEPVPLPAHELLGFPQHLGPGIQGLRMPLGCAVEPVGGLRRVGAGPM
jgi:hypothetical protein